MNNVRRIDAGYNIKDCNRAFQTKINFAIYLNIIKLKLNIIFKLKLRITKIFFIKLLNLVNFT